MQSASIDCNIADSLLLQALIDYHHIIELAHFVYSQSHGTDFLATLYFMMLQPLQYIQP